jgi:hypothetical protein
MQKPVKNNTFLGDTTISSELIRQYQSVTVRQYNFEFLKQKLNKNSKVKKKREKRE